MRILGPINSGLATGANDVATNNTSTATRVIGVVEAIYVEYLGAGLPATTEITVKTVGTAPSAPTYNLLAVTGNTSGWFYPRVQNHTVAGALIAGEYSGMLIYDNINVKIDKANAGDNINVWLLLSEEAQ